jgi:hypothetical protein
MKSEVGRRAFVGTVATGLPLLAGAGTAALAQSAHGLPHVQVGNGPMDQELQRQIREAVLGMRGPNPAEAARRVATTLRMAAAHYAAHKVDEDVTRSLQAMVRREGPDAFFTRVLSHRGSFAAEVREYGFTTLPPMPTDKTAQRKAVDQMLREGITPLMRAVADEFDRIGSAIDARPSVALAAARRAAYPCPDTSAYQDAVEIIAMASCLWNILACAMFGGAWAGMTIAIHITEWYSGCDR